MFWTANVAISRIAFRSLSVEIIDPPAAQSPPQSYPLPAVP